MEASVAQKERESILEGVNSIKNGPAPLRVAMEICARCGTCARVCPVYNGDPQSRYNPVLRADKVRAVYKKHNTLTGKLIGSLVGARDYQDGEIQEWSDHFYECTGCRRCAVYCPMGIDQSVLTRKARAIIDKMGYTPKRLLDVIEISLKTGNTDGANPEALLDVVGFLESEIKEETGIDVPIPVDKVGSEVYFVPPSGDVLVNPEAIMGTAKVFYHMGIDWTMSSKMFDGANYGLFTGDDESMKADNKNYIDEAKALKCKVIVMGECGHAYRVMKIIMEKAGWWGKLPFKIVNVMEFTADMIHQGKISFDTSKNPIPATYHDPCNFARSCGISDEPRVIMNAACGDFRDMTPNGPENWCCGGGGGLSAMDTIKEWRMTVSGRKKLEQVNATGAKFLSTACSNCKRHLTQLMEHHKTGVTVGGVHDMVNLSIVLDGPGKSTSYFDHISDALKNVLMG